MPVKHQQSKLLSVIDELNESEFNFYLTGSRFFGTAREDSDWDFFVENDQPLHLRNRLTDMGFIKEPTDYGDRQTIWVYKHVTEPIHIQIVKNAKLKVEAQLLLQTMGLHWKKDFMEKRSARFYWDLAFVTIRKLHALWEGQWSYM